MANGLQVDGIVGPLTLAALFGDSGTTDPVAAVEIPERFSGSIKASLGPALASVSPIRRQICLDALQYAIDPYKPPAYPLSFYIRGGNLYNKDLTANIMTMDKLDRYLATPGYAPYYDGGRDEFMRRAAAAQGYKCTGADCSGGIVGLLRHAGVVSTGFDANANTLYGSYSVKTAKPIAGDWAWRSGHIGLYVGGGYVVEWIGGAYGCQLTKYANRKVYNFMTRKLQAFSPWAGCGDPKAY